MKKRMTLSLLSAALLASSLGMAQAKINTLVSPHWCLINNKGEVPILEDGSLCSGPALTDMNLSTFAQFYPSPYPLQEGWTQQPRLVPFMAFSTSRMPLGMVDGQTAQQFDYEIKNPVLYQWRNISKLVYFGGSVNEGQILLPTPGWIKAAHQNGAEIFASLFLSPDAFGGTLEQSQIQYMFTKDAAGHYPVAEQMVKLAKLYGFDGYFINFEASYPSGFNNQDLANFASDLRQLAIEAKVPMKVEWYLVWESDDENSFFNHGQQTSDSLFVDYHQWDNNNITHAIKKGYPVSKIEFGVNGALGFDVQDAPNQASIAEFAYEAILKSHANNEFSPTQQLANSKRFWAGVPPRLLASNGAKIHGSYFETHFNAGQGQDYYLDGQKQGYGAWSEIGLQDYLPDLSHSALHLDFNTAYQGGSSLKVNQKKALRLPLFENLAIETPNAVLTTQYQLQSGHYKLCALSEQKNRRCLPLTKTHNGWQQTAVNLPTGTYSQLYLKGQGELQLGQIYLGQAELPLAQVSDLKLVKTISDGEGKHYLTQWQGTGATLYRITVDGRFHSDTFQPVADVMSTQDIQRICIAAQNAAGVLSDHVCIKP